MGTSQEAKNAVPQTSSLWAGSFEIPNRPRPGLRVGAASCRAPEQLAAPAMVSSTTEACKDLAAQLMPPSSLHDVTALLPMAPGGPQAASPGCCEEQEGTPILTWEKLL